jgi:Holliday junction resolvase
MNSREKGKRGERQWRDELRAQGYAARRGQQFSGSPDSPDVVCEELRWIHFEVKAVERLNIEEAMDQARRDSARVAPGGHKIPIVAHRRSFRPWLVTMTAEVFFKFLRGVLPATGVAANALQREEANTKTKTNEQPNENQTEQQ